MVASAASPSPAVAAASAPALTCSLPKPRNASTTSAHHINFKKPLPPGHHPIMVVPGFITSQLRRTQGPTCGMLMPWNR